MTKLEKLSRHKDSSLLQTFVNYGQFFNDINPWQEYYKSFFSVIYECTRLVFVTEKVCLGQKLELITNSCKLQRKKLMTSNGIKLFTP